MDHAHGQNSKREPMGLSIRVKSRYGLALRAQLGRIRSRISGFGFSAEVGGAIGSVNSDTTVVCGVGVEPGVGAEDLGFGDWDWRRADVVSGRGRYEVNVKGRIEVGIVRTRSAGRGHEARASRGIISTISVTLHRYIRPSSTSL